MKPAPFKLPLIPILRGIQSHEAVAIAQALVDLGFDCIEVPLNSPNAFDTLALLRSQFPGIQLGAGTVLKTSEVDQLAGLRLDLIIAPNCDVKVIERALHHGMRAMPGVATPSECFAAIEAGALQLKAFPAEMITPVVLKAWKAVLPVGAGLYPVGGISAENMASYLRAGAEGFGFGSSVYAPGDAPEAVARKAERLILAWEQAHGRYLA